MSGRADDDHDRLLVRFGRLSAGNHEKSIEPGMATSLWETEGSLNAFAERTTLW